MQKTDVDSIFKNTDKKCLEVLKQIAAAEITTEKVLEELEIDTFDIITTVRKQPRRLAFYSGLLAMVNSAIKKCDTTLEILSGELFDYYSQSYEIDLKSSDVKYYITHDEKYRRIRLLKDNLVDQQEFLQAIVNAFDQRSYSINNAVKVLLMEFERSKMEV